MGVVWAEFVTTSIVLVTTSEKMAIEGMGGHYTERAEIHVPSHGFKALHVQCTCACAYTVGATTVRQKIGKFLGGWVGEGGVGGHCH